LERHQLGVEPLKRVLERMRSRVITMNPGVRKQWFVVSRGDWLSILPPNAWTTSKAKMASKVIGMIRLPADGHHPFHALVVLSIVIIILKLVLRQLLLV